jgi:hypothetical protein
MVVITTNESFYVLTFHRQQFLELLEQGQGGGQEGYESAFEFMSEIPEW